MAVTPSSNYIAEIKVSEAGELLKITTDALPCEFDRSFLAYVPEDTRPTGDIRVSWRPHSGQLIAVIEQTPDILIRVRAVFGLRHRSPYNAHAVLRLEDAIRKATSLPAQRLGIRDRGLLREGFYADVVIFDPRTIADKATFEQPHQYAVGISHVLVNGEVVVDHGRITDARPGMVVRGPGYRRRSQ